MSYVYHQWHHTYINYDVNRLLNVWLRISVNNWPMYWLVSHTHTHTIDVIVDVRMTSCDVRVGIGMTSLPVYAHMECDTRLLFRYHKSTSLRDPSWQWYLKKSGCRKWVKIWLRKWFITFLALTQPDFWRFLQPLLNVSYTALESISCQLYQLFLGVEVDSSVCECRRPGQMVAASEGREGLQQTRPNFPTHFS